MEQVFAPWVIYSPEHPLLAVVGHRAPGKLSLCSGPGLRIRSPGPKQTWSSSLKKAGKNWSLNVFKYLNDGQIKSPREADFFFFFLFSLLCYQMSNNSHCKKLSPACQLLF